MVSLCVNCVSVSEPLGFSLALSLCLCAYVVVNVSVCVWLGMCVRECMCK